MIESSSYRVLVLEPSAKVRRDYQAMLTPSLAEGSGVGSDALEALVAGVMAPPPGFPAVDLTLCRKPAEALRSLDQAKVELRPFAIAFVEPGGEPGAPAIVERLRELDEGLYIVLVTSELQIHPKDLAERAPPLDQLYFLSKPFHAFEIQQMVVSLGSRWTSERSGDLPGGTRASAYDARSEEAYARPWEYLPAALVMFDRRDTLAFTNSAARETLPELAPVFAAGTPYETFQREFARRLLAEDTVIREDAWLRDRLEWHAKSGSVIEQRLRGNRWILMTESSGSAGETYCLILDISSLKRRDHSRAMTQRVAQIGNGLEAFCGELLKVFGRPLPAKGGEAEASDFERFMTVLSELGAKTMDRRRAALLIGKLRRLIAPESPHIEALSLNDLISSLPRTAPENDKGGRLEVVVGAGLWPVDSDQALLADCLNELVANARAAAGVDKAITIEAENVRVNRDFVATRPALTPGDYVRLSVRDQGPGMSPDVVERAINPFFRSDKAPPGMGLGLSAVFATISRLGGHIEIEAGPDAGVAVHLYLPRSGASPTGIATPWTSKRDKDGAS
jgi:signal transduction histidine kinase